MVNQAMGHKGRVWMEAFRKMAQTEQYYIKR